MIIFHLGGWLGKNWLLLQFATICYFISDQELGCASREKQGMGRAQASFQLLARTLKQVGQTPPFVLTQAALNNNWKAVSPRRLLPCMSTLALLAHQSYKRCHIFSYPTDLALTSSCSSHNSCCYGGRVKQREYLASETLYLPDHLYLCILQDRI